MSRPPCAKATRSASTPSARSLFARSEMVRMAMALAMTACTASLPAAAIPDRLKDPEDGAFDLGDYLLRHRGVLPMPIVVTEPAVGYGGGVALMYFGQSFADNAEAARARGERIQPPDITAIAGVK